MPFWKSLAVCGVLFWAAMPSVAGELTLSIEGLRSAKGLVSICLVLEPTAFPDCRATPPSMRRSLRADSLVEPVVFDGLEDGTLAVVVLHDENANGRLDTNLFGIPREGVAISNNRLRRFAAPRFGDAAFRFAGESAQSVRMVYW